MAKMTDAQADKFFKGLSEAFKFSREHAHLPQRERDAIMIERGMATCEELQEIQAASEAQGDA